MRNRYPVFVISKGRHDCCLTARFLAKEGAEFRLVVEPQERTLYAAEFGEERLLVTPFSNLGLGSIPVRNFVWETAKAEGHARHWVLDDNIKDIVRMFRGKRIRCHASTALRAVEDFVDRYENVAVAGLNYAMFIGVQPHREPPFLLNCRVYSCLLIDCSVPQRWRGRYNEDADLCLQVLSAGLCTVLINVFLSRKMRTMTMKGGNSAELYKGDGRLKMARSLERMWPGVVETKRRFKRPQHVVKHAWRRFDTPLKLKPGVDLQALQPNEYGLKLVQRKPIVSDAVAAIAASAGLVPVRAKP